MRSKGPMNSYVQTRDSPIGKQIIADIVTACGDNFANSMDRILSTSQTAGDALDRLNNNVISPYAPGYVYSPPVATYSTGPSPSGLDLTNPSTIPTPVLAPATGPLFDATDARAIAQNQPSIAQQILGEPSGGSYPRMVGGVMVYNPNQLEHLKHAYESMV